MMLGENPTHEAENDWAEKYSVIVSKIIDDANNAFIRELILSDEKEKYEEVSKILIKIFEEEGKRAA
jgi:hypothetical protein